MQRKYFKLSTHFPSIIFIIIIKSNILIEISYAFCAVQSSILLHSAVFVTKKVLISSHRFESSPLFAMDFSITLNKRPVSASLNWNKPRISGFSFNKLEVDGAGFARIA